MIIVSVLIYSGRENPRWVMDGESERTVLEELRNLPVVPCASFDAPGLGYSGLELARDRGPGETDTWHLYNGTLRHAGQCFEDRDRRIERSVIAMGRAELGDRLPVELL